MMSLFFSSFLGLFTPDLFANQKWTNADTKVCIRDFDIEFVDSSGGIQPPRGMAKYYCNCAKNSLNAGDNLNDTISYCVQQTYRKFEYWYDNL